MQLVDKPAMGKDSAICLKPELWVDKWSFVHGGDGLKSFSDKVMVMIFMDIVIEGFKLITDSRQVGIHQTWFDVVCHIDCRSSVC